MPFSPDTKLHLVNNIDTAHELKRWLGERKRSALGLDIETSGLDSHSVGARIRMIQVGDLFDGWAIPFEGWGGVALEILRAWDGKIVLHGGMFDIPWLRRHAGYKVPRHQFDDSMVAAKIANPGKPADLKGLLVKHIDPSANSGEKALKKAFKDNGWDWDTVPIDHPAYWYYSALDAVGTAHLQEFYDAEKNHPEVYEMEMAALNIAMEMSWNGSRIDPEYSSAKRDELHEYAASNKQWALDNWGVNINSSDQMIPFFQSLGVSFTKRTKGGAFSLDKKVLEKLEISQDPTVSRAARFIMDTKRADKWATAYFGNFLSMSEHGLLHPYINTIEARTSRMSITRPALQQIPSKDALVRGAFIPRNEGEQIVSVDYSQVELRILANLTGDPQLIADFHDADNNGGNFFANMGKSIYKDPSFNKHDKRRGNIKSSMYGMNYGAGAETVAGTVGRPVEEIRQVLASIFETYPGIKKFQRDTIADAERREREFGEGWIETDMGRKLPVDAGYAYRGVNYAIQGRAAEVMKRAIIRLDNAGLTPYMMLPIHDEVVSSVPIPEIKDFIHESEAIMAELEHPVKLVAEGEGGFDRWGDKYS